jgi:hypothetical protein
VAGTADEATGAVGGLTGDADDATGGLIGDLTGSVPQVPPLPTPSVNLP